MYRLKVLFPIITPILIILLLVSFAFAGQATYIYDDLGRLIRVIDGEGNAATYNYDEVGNLLSITTSAKDELRPVITGVDPDFVRAGATVDLTLSGKNLLGSDLTTDNPGLNVMETRVTDTTITATITVSTDAREGSTLITVSNLIGSASIDITVYPPSPDIELSPSVLVVQPDGGTGTMTVSLSNPDIYPTTIVLEIDNTAIASADPSQVTIPTGETAASVTITGKVPGVTGITASTGVTTAQATINVAGPLAGTNYVYSKQVGVSLESPPKPPKLVSREPILSPVVGVDVEAPPPSPEKRTYGPIQSAPVGIAFGPTISSVTPNKGAIGSTDLSVTINGSGLEGTTSVSFQPSTGITINGSPSVSGDGRSVTISISISQDAPLTTRTIVVNTSAGMAKPSKAGVNLFTVTLPSPEIISIIPITSYTGSTFTLQVNGRNLSGASRVDFVPSDGVTIGNPPSINTEGTLATVQVSIANNAPVGQRVVTITTGGGTTTETPSNANTFTITEVSGATYTPLLSPMVGVEVSKPPVSTSITISPMVSPSVGVNIEEIPVPEQPLNITPLTTPIVGVVSGSAITSIEPKAGAQGTTVRLTINGINLQNVTSVTLTPGTGIITGSFSISTDGTSIEMDLTISQDAPLQQHTVSAITPSGRIQPATPFANIFTVAPPVPEILSIIPIQQTAGSTFTLTINGRNLKGATLVEFTPGDGIFVGNPPSVNADGTLATVSVSIATAASPGQRLVTITTPTGTSSTTATSANTFTVIGMVGLNSEDQRTILSMDKSLTAVTSQARWNPSQGIDNRGLETGEISNNLKGLYAIDYILFVSKRFYDPFRRPREPT